MTATIESVDQLAETPDKILGIDEIEHARDGEFAEVLVPEWGGKIRMSTMNAEGTIETLKNMQVTGEVIDGLLQLLVQCFVDAEGNRQVTDPERIVAIAKKLRKKEAVVIERLLREFVKLNKIPLEVPSLTAAV